MERSGKEEVPGEGGEPCRWLQQGQRSQETLKPTTEGPR